MYTSIYLTNRRKGFFFSVPYLEYDFMIAHTIRLNLAVLKTTETSQEHISGGGYGMLVGLQAFIPQFN